jgi:UDP-N-acetylmuramoylalanine--D-glutamate ligase
MMTSTNGLAGGVPDVAGRRVLVYSMGIEGQDLAQWLVARGARVTMSDTRSEKQLAAAGAKAPGGVERVVSGEGLLDAGGFDLVAVSQSILRHDPALQRARAAQVPITSQMRLFLQLCPGRLVGITGSSGKSTTTALVGAMAEAAGLDPVVGGNIGEPLLRRIEEIGPGTTVILEISHTQLQYTSRSPAIAAITNVTPNHLDQFSWDEYVGLKRNLLRYQTAEDVAVLNADDHTSRGIVTDVRGRLLLTSCNGDPGPEGAWLDRDEIRARQGKQTRTVLRKDAVRLRGEHNVANVVMATAVASAMGLPDEAIREAASSFRGLRHRLEPAGVVDGVTYVNDSIATSPERTVAGLLAFTEPVVLLLGGREKKLPFDRLQDLIRTRCRAVLCFGEAAEVFAEASRGFAEMVAVVATLDDAVERASRLAKAGDVVLLAPAGTSFDAYPSFQARGDHFKALVSQLAGFEEVAP